LSQAPKKKFLHHPEHKEYKVPNLPQAKYSL
jgi:hypothetical protein